MDSSDVNPYDRIPVIIEGVELYVRPIDFIMDPDGLPMKAIKWESVHPHTGQLLQFGEDEIFTENNVIYYGKSDKKPIVKVVENVEYCPFQDPIELGLLTI